jgi:hypothetical protein
MITKSLPIAENSIERIEALISKLGPTLNFTEISELAVAIHELKNFVNEVREMQNLQANTPVIASGSRARYRKFIVVTNDNLHHPMKDWVKKNQQFEKYGSKISHEISRILVNKYHFRKVINSQTNEVMHYQP